VTESYNITTLLNGRNFQRIVKMGKKPLENRVENNSHKKEKCETFFFFLFFFFHSEFRFLKKGKKKEHQCDFRTLPSSNQYQNRISFQPIYIPH
jgi:hypothetical protein